MPAKGSANTSGYLRTTGRKITAALKWLTRNPLNRAAGLILIAAAAILGGMGTALILGVLSPQAQITVSAFEIFSADQKAEIQGGKALADLAVDDLHRILEEAGRFSGNPFSSAKTFPSIPDMPQIPIDTSYGIEIYGVSLDHLLALWDRLRYQKFQVTGDLIAGSGGEHVIRLRYTTRGRANSFEEPLSQVNPATIKEAVSNLSVKLVAEINPIAAARYLIAEAMVCKGATQCESSWRSAIQHGWDWTKKEPENALAFFYLGYALQHTQHPEDALIVLEDALRLNSRLDLALVLKGNILANLGQFAQAEAMYREALSIRTSPNPLMNLGVAALRQGNYEAAERLIQSALAQDPNDVGAYLNLGTALLRLSKNPEAVRVFRQARNLQPDNYLALRGLADSLARDNRPGDALRECEEAARLDPASDDPILIEGIVFLLAKQTAQAIERFESVIHRTDPWEAHILLGVAYLENGELNSASAEGLGMLALVPEFPAAHVLMAMVLEAQGDPRGSKLHADESERLSPGIKYASWDEL